MQKKKKKRKKSDGERQILQDFTHMWNDFKIIIIKNKQNKTLRYREQIGEYRYREQREMG